MQPLLSYLATLAYIVAAVLLGGCANCINAAPEPIDWPEPETTICLRVHQTWTDAGWDREWITEAAKWWTPSGRTVELTNDPACERTIRVGHVDGHDGIMLTVHGVRKHIVIDPDVAEKFCEFGHCRGGSVVTLIAHEIGHMLGAGHSDDKADLMWPDAATWSHRYPTAADYDRVDHD